MRVGSTPRGTEKEQREHLPPHQEQLFNPPRRGDAGMGGSSEGQKGGRQSYTRLLFSFTCSPLQSLRTPHPFLIPSGFMETGGVDLCFFHFSLSQIKFRKLPVYLQVCKIRAVVLICRTCETPVDLWMHMSFSVGVCIELTFNMPISSLNCNTNNTTGFLLSGLLVFFPNSCCQNSPLKPIER